MRALICLLFILPLLTACGSSSEISGDPLLPLPETSIREPSNSVMLATIDAYVKQQHGPPQSQYQFTRVDLNGDGRRDGIVLMKSPHNHWCDINGCRMLVFRAYDEDFDLISEIAPVRGPLLVSEGSTEGWRDLIIRVSGRSTLQSRDAILRFDGMAYPNSPVLQPAIYASNELPGTWIFP
ncbi:MAG: hypothetical protein H6868_08750 [Rhodospirillales bacterium]|nr:hypothetical protein [Rhodospirillales bacterium]